MPTWRCTSLIVEYVLETGRIVLEDTAANLISNEQVKKSYLEAEAKMSKQTVAVIGASADKNKFSNKAIMRIRGPGYDVYPVNPKEENHSKT